MKALKHNIAVIIVNYNAGKLLAGNLQRIFDSAGDDIRVHVFIIDNQSPDNSVEVLKQKISMLNQEDSITLIQAERNGGFAYGNNLGFNIALASEFNPDYFYLLNPDAVPERGAIDATIALAKSRYDYCIIGSQMLDEVGNKAASAFRFPSLISEFNRSANIGLVTRLFPAASLVFPTNEPVVTCDWVCGAGFLIPIKAYKQLGEMDEQYFLYYEEVDYMKRAKEHKIPVLVAEKSKVIHIAGISTGIVGNKVEESSIPVYWYQSWHRYYFKNHSKSKAFMCGIAWIVGRIVNNTLAFFFKVRKPKDGHSIARFWSYAILGKK